MAGAEEVEVAMQGVMQEAGVEVHHRPVPQAVMLVCRVKAICVHLFLRKDLINRFSPTKIKILVFW